MAIKIHTITRYTVQVLTKRAGEAANTIISVRLYDDDNKNRGVALFQNYGAEAPPKPTGDYKAQKATSYLDISLFDAYIGVLRLESPVYLKVGWFQQGRAMTVGQVSIDTKKDVIGEYFEKSPKG